MTTTLGIFNTKLIAFFEDLSQTFPEERDIKMALEGIQGAKKVNPRLVLDLFTEYVAKPLTDPILAQDEEKIITYAKLAISTQFNEMSPALMIFDKYWPSLSDGTRDAIWKHLKVLVLLAERAKA